MMKAKCNATMLAASIGFWMLSPALEGQDRRHRDKLAAGKGYSRTEVAKLFQGQCHRCHLAPDPSEKLDLAWLDQVNRTA